MYSPAYKPSGGDFFIYLCQNCKDSLSLEDNSPMRRAVLRDFDISPIGQYGLMFGPIGSYSSCPLCGRDLMSGDARFLVDVWECVATVKPDSRLDRVLRAFWGRFIAPCLDLVFGVIGSAISEYDPSVFPAYIFRFLDSWDSWDDHVKAVQKNPVNSLLAELTEQWRDIQERLDWDEYSRILFEFFIYRYPWEWIDAISADGINSGDAEIFDMSAEELARDLYDHGELFDDHCGVDPYYINFERAKEVLLDRGFRELKSFNGNTYTIRLR